MNPNITKLTVRLPKRRVEFVKGYARAHGLTVTDVIDRYLRRIQSAEGRPPAPGLEDITGLVPADIDAEGEYRRHVQRRHHR